MQNFLPEELCYYGARIAHWSITFCHLISFFLDSMLPRNVFLWSWGNNFWHEWHTNSFESDAKLLWVFCFLKNNLTRSPNILKRWWHSTEFLSVLGQGQTLWSLPSHAMRPAMHGQWIQGLHHLSYYLPHYHDMTQAKASPHIPKQQIFQKRAAATIRGGYLAWCPLFSYLPPCPNHF